MITDVIVIDGRTMVRVDLKCEFCDDPGATPSNPVVTAFDAGQGDTVRACVECCDMYNYEPLNDKMQTTADVMAEENVALKARVVELEAEVTMWRELEAES